MCDECDDDDCCGGDDYDLTCCDVVDSVEWTASSCRARNCFGRSNRTVRRLDRTKVE